MFEKVLHTSYRELFPLSDGAKISEEFYFVEASPPKRMRKSNSWKPDQFGSKKYIFLKFRLGNFVANFLKILPIKKIWLGTWIFQQMAEVWRVMVSIFAENRFLAFLAASLTFGGCREVFLRVAVIFVFWTEYATRRSGQHNSLFSRLRSPPPSPRTLPRSQIIFIRPFFYPAQTLLPQTTQ